MLDKLKQRIKETREKIEEGVADGILLDQSKVDQATQQFRYSICESCENLYKVSNRCRLCGCFMGVKTWLKSQSCPIKKWDAEEF